MGQIRPEYRPKVLFWTGSVLAAFGTIILAGTISSHFRADATWKWPTVKGKVTVSEMVTRQESREYQQCGRTRKYRKLVTVYEAEVRYAYSVHGKEYEGDRITFFEGTTDHSDLAQEDLDRYPAGAEVTVHYKPDDPAESVLEPGAGPVLIAGIVMALILLGLAAVVFYARAAETRKRKGAKGRE